MTQESFLPHSLRVSRHEPEVLESLDEQNQKLLAEVKTELHEIDDELVRVSLCPMGASGRKKKSFGERAWSAQRAAVAADAFGANRQYVSDAKKIQAEAPDVFQRLKSGNLTMRDAPREVNPQAAEVEIN